MIFFLSSFRRARRWRNSWLRLLFISISSFLIIDFIRITHSSSPILRISPSSQILRKEKVFIASTHWNNEKILRSHWNKALVDLVRQFGPENVYISISEGGSWDNSKGALRELDTELEKLGVARMIELNTTTHQEEIERISPSDEEGWISTSGGKKELRRIPYLSKIRNRVMERLTELSAYDEPKIFDKVLWLNDVVFTTEDVLTLLNTRDGEYAAACSMDFSKPPIYYDTFALRDISGARSVSLTWPYFLSSTSRHALVSNAPVPVQSCWNGIIALDAAAFYTHPPLKFRGVPDSLANYHLEASECCLIHADNHLSSEKGVWLNPHVRVGYNAEAYDTVNPLNGETWPSPAQKVLGIWGNRWARVSGMPRRLTEQYVVKKRVRQWARERNEDETRGGENGVHCMINEMQILAGNGWKHL
ncbi:glycosyltransferase family 69 protein [Patellaria atrata CBS 101060]|uniref:Glycosyltransferase family 69 protein n=1 Tax=Patellaria atrata CBS 101060 TaxID=1346257 RepID=A0A9P4VQL2_9PEZI|nr:glycosyltransferase family 69 protein [Patellaria atrata CBS 101060]